MKLIVSDKTKTDNVTEASRKYPVGGPRQPVYDLMRSLGFSMAHWSDKLWRRADNIEVLIYGAGSRARILINGEPKDECELDKLEGHLRGLR